MGIMNKTLLKTKSVFRSLINTSVWRHAIKSNVRGSNKIKMTLLDFYQHDNTSLYSSIVNNRLVCSLALILTAITIQLQAEVKRMLC